MKPTKEQLKNAISPFNNPTKEDVESAIEFFHAMVHALPISLYEKIALSVLIKYRDEQN